MLNMTRYVVAIMDFSKRLQKDSLFSLLYIIQFTSGVIKQISSYYSITLDPSFYAILS